MEMACFPHGHPSVSCSMSRWHCSTGVASLQLPVRDEKQVTTSHHQQALTCSKCLSLLRHVERCGCLAGLFALVFTSFAVELLSMSAS